MAVAEIIDTDDRARAIENFVRKRECELDPLYFHRYFFKQRFQTKMLVVRHHQVVQAALNRTLLPPGHPDFIPRLIINIPFGYSKTEQASINYIAHGLAVNPMSRFLHLSYSDALVLLNSSVARSIVKSANYQALWPVEIKTDSDSKKIWHTTHNGGVTATAAGGQVTGFRAGHMIDDKFYGAITIDDPIKPDDTNYETKRDIVNNSFNETVSTRVALETTPIILIMQRLHWHDLSGYLLRGGSGEKWHHLNLPMYIDNKIPYPDYNTHGIPIPHGLPDGWLWPYKHNDKHATALRAHRRKWFAQCLQAPKKHEEDSQLWTEQLINWSREVNHADTEIPIRTVVAVDPATTDTETSDEHGIVVGSKYYDNRYSLDADYSCNGSPKTWADKAIWAYEHHNADAIVIETNQGGDMCESNLRNNGFKGRVIRVHAKKNKTLRAEPVVSLYEQKQVQHKGGMITCEDEMMDFDPVTQKSNGHSPNRVDAAVYVLTELAGLAIDFGSLLDMSMGSR